MPTPWRIRDDFGGGWIQGSPVEGETYGDQVATVAKPKTVGSANAAFIVEAVNNHARLTREREALRAALEQIQEGIFPGAGDIVSGWEFVSNLQEIAQAALASLEPKDEQK